MKAFFGLRALALAALLAPSAAARGDDAQIEHLRAEMDKLRAEYETRLAALARQVEELGRRAPPAGASAATGRASAASAFNPEVSLVLNGSYRRAGTPQESGISGFVSGAHGHGGHEEAEGPPRGFSLDESELVLGANVDHLFRGQLNLALAEGEVEVEEAWVQTLALGHGSTLKAGRFLSGIGYANAQHPHQRDFAEPALMQVALFGEHGSYGNDGLQLTWVAPLETWLELGAEVGRGANFPGTDRNQNGNGATALFARLGGDVGASSSWRAGLSWLATRAEGRESHFEDVLLDEEVIGAFSGTSRSWIADLVWKWAPDGNPKARHLTLQAEVFRRTESGELSCVEDESPDCGAFGDGDYLTRQSGGYLQAVYQFRPAWRTGLRFDRLSSGHIDYGAADDRLLRSDHSPRRSSLMVDWSPTEFSRVRLQYARDQSIDDFTDHQWTLQYIMSLGAHPAHAF